MKTGANDYSRWFYSALAGIAMVGPIMLVLTAATLPEGRGDLIVYGHGVLLAVILVGLLLRAVYIWGFKSAVKNSGSDSIAYEKRGGGHSMQY